MDVKSFWKQWKKMIVLFILLMSAVYIIFRLYNKNFEDTEEVQRISEEAQGISEEAEETADNTDQYLKYEENNAEDILKKLTADEGFKICVWNDAGIEEGDTKEQILQKMNQCERLAVDDFWGSLYSLEYLSIMPNLKSLSIDTHIGGESEIEDFTPIAALSQLESLHITYAETEMDFSFLAEMKTITELSLSNCRIKDTAFLEKMTQLKSLDLVETSITDISFLSSLTELESVNLNENFITDLTPMSGLTKLECLRAEGNEIMDISPLNSLSGLFILELDQNKISDISTLRSLPHLNQVSLSSNCISDLSPLEGKEELMYLEISGNPVIDIRPVLDVTLFSYMDGDVTEDEAETAGNWMKKQYPEVTEFECIDFVEGDLNKDGRMDIAFVMDGTFENEDSEYDGPVPSRYLFVLLGQKNGSWQELDALPLMGKYDGGTRGDPHRGVFLGEGYLMVKSGWGSGSGGEVMDIYCGQKGTLELVKVVWVEDYSYTDSYDVSVSGNNAWFRYIIAMDGERMIRVDLADLEHPFHEAFAGLRLNICDEKPEIKIKPVEALDIFKDKIAADAERADLPYAPWQKESYELLAGMELPDYYYILPGTEEKAEEISDEASEEAWKGDYIYYSYLSDYGDRLHHIICYVTKERKKEYKVYDDTGKIE